MKIVGIHFGYNWESASYIGGADTNGVNPLKLINTTDNYTEKWIIPSDLYQYKASNGNFAYSLEKPLVPHTLLSK